MMLKAAKLNIKKVDYGLPFSCHHVAIIALTMTSQSASTMKFLGQNWLKETYREARQSY